METQVPTQSATRSSHGPSCAEICLLKLTRLQTRPSYGPSWSSLTHSQEQELTRPPTRPSYGPSWSSLTPKAHIRTTCSLFLISEPNSASNEVELCVFGPLGFSFSNLILVARNLDLCTALPSRPFEHPHALAHDHKKCLQMILKS